MVPSMPESLTGALIYCTLGAPSIVRHRNADVYQSLCTCNAHSQPVDASYGTRQAMKCCLGRQRVRRLHRCSTTEILYAPLCNCSGGLQGVRLVIAPAYCNVSVTLQGMQTENMVRCPAQAAVQT